MKILLLMMGLATHAAANDYALSTNIVARGHLPWPIAVFLIDSFVPEGEERVAAIGSLIKYQSAGLVRHLKRYSQDPSPAVRAASFWPLYKNGERETALSIMKQELATNQRAVIGMFYIPNWVGTEYRLEMSREDQEYRALLREATRSADDEIQVHAAIHLAFLGEKALAVQTARGIMKREKGPARVRTLAEGCLKIAGDDSALAPNYPPVRTAARSRLRTGAAAAQRER